jgi:hypothetical protein
MRSYPRNSAEAAGRIVALTLLADGNVCSTEIGLLQQHNGAPALGLAPQAWSRLLQEVAEDLMHGLCATGSLLASLDEATLRAMLHEVDAPQLQREVLRLVRAAAAADRHLAEAEQMIIDAARRHWPGADDGIEAAKAMPVAA